MTITFTVVLIFFSIFFLRAFNGNSTNEDTYRFIDQNLRNSNGTFATYMQEDTEEDADEVQGKEALSETVGLWMEYALTAGKQELFEEAYQQLNQFFLDQDGFIYWKLSKEGEYEEYINALIDDVRIIKALWAAHERWGDDKYRETADNIGKAVGENNVYESVMIDFYDKSIGYSSDFLTTSYLGVEDLDFLLEKEYITPEVHGESFKVLQNLPKKNGFYPKTYMVERDELKYDAKINMIDQLIVALNSPGESKELTSFIEEEVNTRGTLHGIYSLNTKEPLVDYESPAIYGLLISYAIKFDNEELAMKTYDRLIEFRENGGEYKGGYSVGEDENTHIFDNLLPMIAIEELKNAGWLNENS
ncbi:glycosyl hydrolase family 8 [Salimicrobium flavidum]|uniref:Glycosyl hydrolases family 8 n=1 Tax=Salimicrobium flavidum TaxID=570947 RepID=A0A1N7IZI4_9BACI|nr:glycosyl hydrolase family 8 [Salimicrobium flavidum]SIS42470.1 Glycosyl hydrolases family 8 [Salimicrobium flavidum]